MIAKVCRLRWKKLELVSVSSFGATASWMSVYMKFFTFAVYLHYKYIFCYFLSFHDKIQGLRKKTKPTPALYVENWAHGDVLKKNFFLSFFAPVSGGEFLVVAR